MVTPDTINDIPVEAVESMLAKDSLSIDQLEELIVATADPEKLKLLVLALERAKKREEEKVQRLLEELETARTRVQQVEDTIRRTQAVIDEQPVSKGFSF